MTVFEEQVNVFRDVAMKKKLFLSFYKEKDNLECSIIMGFDDLDSATRCAEEIKSEVYCLDGDSYKWVGDEYTSNG